MTDDFIDDFIKEYQQQPCLWKATCVDFKNRKKRQEAYLKLIDIATQHGETYNIERTKQKINNLRCAFRVQLKKYTDFKNNPKGNKEEAYCPKRKYMESLMFLLNEEKPAVRRRKSSTTETDDTQHALKMRRKIDKELDAITMSLGSDIEDNIEQPISDKLEFVEVEQTSQKDVKDECPLDSNSDNTDVLKIEEPQSISSPDLQQSPLKMSDEEGTVIWSQPIIPPQIIEKKTRLVQPKFNNIQSSTVQQARVVDVRTVKQPAIVRQIPTNYVQKKNVNIVLRAPQQTRNENKVIKSSSSVLPKMLPKELIKHTVKPVAIPPVPINCTATTTNNITSHSDTSQSEVDHIKIKCDSSNFENLLTLACSRITQIADSEDDFGVFGKMVTCKLRGMDSQQALIAQKLISNILFDGQLKILELPQRISPGPPALMTQQLHSTTIRPIRNSTTGQQTFYISGMNGTTATSTTDDATAQLFNTSSGDTHVHILGK